MILKKAFTWWVIVGLVGAFAAGLFLRGPISGGADWCRDVDYGSLPQWLTLVLGLVAGVLTFLGVRTAQRSLETSRDAHLADIRTREYAQARLVYGELVTRDRLVKGTTKRVPVLDPQVEIIQFLSRVNGPYEKDSTGAIVDPRFPTRSVYQAAGSDVVVEADEDCYIYLIRVNNDSDELISGVTATMRQGQDETGGGMSRVLVRPRSIVERLFVLADADALTNPRGLEIKFRDATGQWWAREGPEPVRKVEPS